MNDSLIQKFHFFEIAGLFILAFSLPVFGAPKYLGYCVLVTGAAGWRLCDRKIKLRKPAFYEVLIIMVLLISLISTFINWPLHYGIKGFKHSFYFFSMFWILSRGGYNKDTIKKTMILLIIGTIIAALTGFWQFKCGNAKEFNLLSLNGIDRSAGYIAIIIFVCLGIILDNCSGYNRISKFFAISSLFLCFLCLFVMGSRGCILSVMITFPILFVVISRSKIFEKFLPVLLICTLSVVILTALIASFPNSKYLQRFRHIGTIRLTLNPSEMSYNDQERYDYWRVALMYAIKNPSFFGVGPRNFREIDISKLKVKRPLTKIASETFKNKQALHAHNWILTVLVEQGFLGLIAFVVFLITIMVKLIKKKPEDKINAVWVAAFSTCFLPCISGLFNSAFTNENGWLTFFVFGLGMWFIHEN